MPSALTHPLSLLHPRTSPWPPPRREVTIHRLLVAGSVEEKVVSIAESKHALLAGEEADNVATVDRVVKKEEPSWAEVQAMVDAAVNQSAAEG